MPKTKPDSYTYNVLKKKKEWHHDIKYIDGKFIEHVVDDFQKEQDPENKEKIINKIIDNYAIYRNKWAYGFAPFLDNDIENGKMVHDQIIWKSACKFNREKVNKPDGKAFNAYLVSAQLNSMKNMRNTRMSHKNHPRIKCPICGDKVYQIDEKHLKHEFDIKRYKKSYSEYPVSCTNGLVICPITNEIVPEITEARINRLSIDSEYGYYTIEDFKQEYGHLIPKNVKCPLTGMAIDKVTATYPSLLMPGYTEETFVKDFPNFKGIIICPFSKEKKLEITQKHLDRVLKQEGRPRRTIRNFLSKYKNCTLKPQQVSVVNPYTKKMVPELTLKMLGEAKTTLREHLSKYATIQLDKRYDQQIICPFTGNKFFTITTEYLKKINKTVQEFYQVTCKYPLRRWKVKCAINGEWVDNISKHLDSCGHNYAQPSNPKDFEKFHGTLTKAFVSTNSYVESDSGSNMHISDMLIQNIQDKNPLEIEDSLLPLAEDDLDRQLIEGIKRAHTTEDIFWVAAKKDKINLDFPFKIGQTKEIKEQISRKTGLEDFDISSIPKLGDKDVDILIPSRETMRKKLTRMIDASDLKDD